jgi:hypothetical protein
MPVIHVFLGTITYYNEQNDFLVAKLQEKGSPQGTSCNPGGIVDKLDRVCCNVHIILR